MSKQTKKRAKLDLLIVQLDLLIVQLDLLIVQLDLLIVQIDILIAQRAQNRSSFTLVLLVLSKRVVKRAEQIFSCSQTEKSVLWSSLENLIMPENAIKNQLCRSS